YIGVSQRIETATGMGMAVVFVMTMAGLVTWILQTFALMPLGLEYLQTIVFILVIASLVQFVEIVIQKMSPVLYEALGIY
ncbi:MAG: electron transport complex subunit RsxA, partial [Anaerolineae bacterium]|nr:electron transport complex subunit RsxA [Anaerolineae bacterium]